MVASRRSVRVNPDKGPSVPGQAWPSIVGSLTGSMMKTEDDEAGGKKTNEPQQVVICPSSREWVCSNYTCRRGRRRQSEQAHPKIPHGEILLGPSLIADGWAGKKIQSAMPSLERRTFEPLLQQ